MNNAAENQFESSTDGKVSVLEYRLEPGRIVFVHTEVPEEIEGRGIGSRLAREGLEYARANKLKVVAQCPFIADYVKAHQEYADLI